MLVGIDIDGTVDAYPDEFRALMQAIRSSGNDVVILTGCSKEKVTPEDITAKKEYLANLGCAECYDSLVVFAHPPEKEKAKWIEENDVDILIDNDRKNCQLASKSCLCLLPWQTRKGKKN